MFDYDLATLLPHSGKMLLLDEVVDHGGDWLQAAVTVTEASQFVENNQLPALVVIEYMAQAIAALAGIRAQKKGEPVRIGLLLGTRKFDSNVDSVSMGTRLLIGVEELFLEENGLAVFKCKATAAGIEMTCNLNVYHPDDIGVLIGE